MTLQVTVIGIDGSGASTVARALPGALSAKLRVTAGFSGDDSKVSAPDEELPAPGFHSEGLHVAARLAKRLERRGKALLDDRHRHPAREIAQILRDAATRNLSRRYGADVFVSDGNTLLSAAGRAASYCLRPPSEGVASIAPRPDASDLLAMFRFILDGEPLPEESAQRLPPLGRLTTTKRLLGWLRLDGVWLPDRVLLLDLRPEEAIRRTEERAAKADGHENLDDLRRTREMYLETLEAFAAYRSMDAVLELPTEGLSTGEILEVAVAWLEDAVSADEQASVTRPLGTTGAELNTKGSSNWEKDPGESRSSRAQEGGPTHGKTG